MIKTKRLFLAIKIIPKPDFVEKLDALKHDLEHEPIKWVHQNNLHLTLKFFGETPINRIDTIVLALKELINSQEKFNLNIENVGIFGSNYQPKLIWAGISKTDELVKFEQDLMRQLEEIVFKNDRQNFIPHLTLGRIKQLSDKKLFQQILNKHKESIFQISEIDKIILFESVLKSGGAIHSVIHEFPFL